MLTTLIILLLVSNAITLRVEYSIYFSRIAIIGLLYVLYLIYTNSYVSYLDHGIALYGGLFSITSNSQMLTFFIILLTSIILTMTSFYPRKYENVPKIDITSILIRKTNVEGKSLINKQAEQFRIIEYPLIISFVLCGAMFLITSADLVSIFLSIELQSYGLYVICTLYRDSETATGSGMTYFLLGGLSSCFILFGSALIYGITGSTELENIYMMTNITENMVQFILNSESFYDIDSYYLEEVYYIQLAIIIMIVGFLFKVSAAPFHFWSPDVYDGIPTIVTTFVAIIAKISIFGFILSFAYNTRLDLFDFSWNYILLISSLLSLIIGSLLGLSQFRIKRLYAYSTISHVGFILLALSIQTPESIQSFLFYILQYSLSNLNAFIILITIGYSLFWYVDKNNERGKLVDQDNSPIQLIEQMKGYFHINPFIAISFTITIFSFVGIPPVLGFFGKQMILSAALDNGYIFMSLVAILTSVIGAGYYLNLVKNIYFFKPNYIRKINININNNTNNVSQRAHNNELIEVSDGRILSVNSSLSTIISIISLVLILFMFNPSQPLHLVNIISLQLFN